MRLLILDSGLLTRVCKKCLSVLVSLLPYGKQMEIAPVRIPLQANAKITAEAKQKSYIRKKYSRIILKFQISATTPNPIDLRTNCDEAFLDHDEWKIFNVIKN